MTRRILSEQNVRKLSKHGASYSVTLPIESIRKLKWREGQKVRKSGGLLQEVVSPFVA